MGSRTIQCAFEQYRLGRSAFAQSVSDFATKAENVEILLSQGAIVLLRNLLTDVCPAIQQSAVVAVGKLGGHDPAIAQLLIQQDLVRTIIYFSMDPSSNKYLKRAALLALRNIVKHSAELSRSVTEIGLDQIINSLNDMDPGVKEAAAWVCGYIARHDEESAQLIMSSGAIPILISSLQEPETVVRAVGASALSDICKHSPGTAQLVIDSGAITHLIRSTNSPDPKLKRQALSCLSNIAKHSLHMAEQVVEGEGVKAGLEGCGHTDELVRKAASCLLRDIVKHTPEMAHLIVEAGGLKVLTNAILKNRDDGRVPPITALGYIAAHGAELAKVMIDSNCTDAIKIALDDDVKMGNVTAAAAWALGHVASHSPEHARSVSLCGILPSILQIYMCESSSCDAKEKCKAALKMILFKVEELSCLDPLLSIAPFNILKYVVAQYSKILPKDPGARRSFVSSGGLKTLQEFLPKIPAEEQVLREHIELINQCFPEEVVKINKVISREILGSVA